MTIRRPLTTRILSWAAFVVVMLTLVPPSTLELGRKTEKSSFLEIARRSTGYIVDREDWLAFALPGGRKQVRIATNANLAGEERGASRGQCAYTIEYQLLTADGEVLLSRSFASRTSESFYEDPETGAILPRRFYLGLGRRPLSTSSVTVKLTGFHTRPERLLIRLSERDESIVDVLTRVYYHEHPPEYRLRYLWQRLSHARRAQLARANVHDPDLLQEAEQRNLLVNRWVALAPEGFKGEEYKSLTLYTLPSSESAAPIVSRIASGVLVTPRRTGVIPIPPGVRELRLESERLMSDASGPEPSELTVRLYSRDSRGVEELSFPLGNGVECHTVKDPGGALEISSPSDVLVRGYAVAPNEELEITPDPLFVEACRTLPEEPLDFEVLTRGIASSWWRVDLRREVPLGTPAGPVAPFEVRFELLQEDGNPVSEGFLLHQEALSLRDDIARREGVAVLTEPSRHYLRVPPRCARLRLSCRDSGALLSVFNRPPDLPRRVRAPEDYSTFLRRRRTSRDWFSVAPRDLTARIAANAVASLRIQPRPLEGSEASEDILDLERTTCAPAESPAAFKIAAPVRVRCPHDEEDSPGRYLALPLGAPAAVGVTSGPGAARVFPKAVVVHAEPAPLDLHLTVDGAPYFETTLGSRSTELELPPLEPGPHEILATASGDAFVAISHLWLSGHETYYVKRAVHLLGRGGLIYPVTKDGSERETISVRVYMPQKARVRPRIRAVLRGARRVEGVAFSSWTPDETVYDLGPPLDPQARPAQAHVLGRPSGPLRAERFFYSLGEDIGSGPHVIEFRLEAGPESFLHLSRTVPRRGAEHRASVEPAWGGELEP